MALSVQDAGGYALDLELRMPFTYGITTVTTLPHAFVRVSVAVDGRQQAGLAAEHLALKWFTKDPEKPVDEEIEELVAVLERACEHARDVGEAETAFDLWWGTYERQRRWGETAGYPPLLWAFGVTLVERAIIDAVCRARDQTFHEAVTENTLGIRPGEIYDELAGSEPADYLAAEPRETIDIRHTVGHTDPLAADDLDPADAVDDGLPQTLAECIDAYGLRRFKVKLAGDPAEDYERIRAVVATVEDRVPDPTYTVDANEQYESVGDLRSFWDAVTDDGDLAGFRDGFAFVEQPFDRRVALDADVGDTLATWDGPPVVIDESDGRLDTLETALDRGYAGTSYKGCKGVFKGIVNAGLIDHRRSRGDTCILSGEDLSTVGPVSLQQDLAVMTTLGLDHAERNGHHYFRGLSMFPDDIQDGTLDAHGDLYRRHRDGYATLDVIDGAVDVGTVVDAPFGYDMSIDPARFTPIDDWTFTP